MFFSWPKAADSEVRGIEPKTPPISKKRGHDFFKRKNIFRFFSYGHVIAQSGMILEEEYVPWKKHIDMFPGKNLTPGKQNRLPAQYRSCHSYPFLVILGYPYARHMLCWIRSWIGILIRLQDCLHCFLDRFALACLHGYLMSGPPSNGE